MAVKSVRLLLYRPSERFFFGLPMNRPCSECTTSYVLLQNFISERLQELPVTLNIKPWLNNWWRALLRGGMHAPVLTVNGRLFSQGHVPDLRELYTYIVSLLDEQDRETFDFPERVNTALPAENRGIVLYYSPACPHCRRLLLFLHSHGISYTGHDVTKTETSRRRVKELTGSMTIPVTVVRSEVIVGFDEEKLRAALSIEHDQVPKTVVHNAVAPQTVAPGEVEGAHGAGVEHGHRGLTVNRLHAIQKKAEAILEGNWVNGWTVPSRKLYPHLWNWDSGFTARGYLYVNPERAYEELRSLFRAQWSNGFLPHIVFNKRYMQHFPGPDYWKAHRSGMIPEGMYTSGISQPPVHATMIARALDLDPDRSRAVSFMREMYEKLANLHRFFYDNRDPDNEDLVYIVHPWESGLDNSPLWDDTLSTITTSTRWASRMQKRYDQLSLNGERPQRAYIEKYSYLVQCLYRKRYDWASMHDTHPFRVQDVLFNTILCRAEQDLALVAREIGKDPEPHLHRARRIAEACNRKLWDEEHGLYCDFDLSRGKLINRDTVFSYMPLFSGIPDKTRGMILLDTLRTHCFCVADGDCVAIPSYDMCQADFEGEFYWRGPVWVNVNWYLAQGVRDYGDRELSAWIEDSLLTLVHTHGFHEYYDPNTGRGLGAGDFSWTAALILDIIGRRMRGE